MIGASGERSPCLTLPAHFHIQFKISLEVAAPRASSRAGLPLRCQTLPGLPRAARPSARFAEGKTPQRGVIEYILVSINI